MRDFIQFFLLCVEAFFILYMVLYSTFLFLSVRWAPPTSTPPSAATG